MVATMYVKINSSCMHSVVRVVINGLVVFHILTFIVWAIIFAKDMLVPVPYQLEDKKKK